MVFLWIAVAIVVVLLAAAGWIDLKAKRAGRPIRGVDRKASLDARRAAQAEYDQRTHHQGYGGGVF
ncbi:MAG TPA: hypothetical protein VH573_06435 [Mycobacteriales bacterium]|jgi:hypothetical protein